MKLALAILLILGAVAMQSEGYRRYRVCRIKYFWIRPSCCRGRYVLIRLYYCYYTCSSGKRSLEPPVQMGFPCNFNEYDTNGDGEISKDELKNTLSLSEEDAGKLFETLDKNEDGSVSCEELQSSDLEFKCKPKACSGGESQDEFWNPQSNNPPAIRTTFDT